MYWNEDYCKKWILEYQNTDSVEEKNRIYTQHLHTPIMAMIKAQINTHKFYYFEDREILISVALETVIKKLDVYDPSYWVESKNRYARAFDYFSLITKQSMFWHTKRNENKRKDAHIEKYYHLQYNDTPPHQLQWESFCKYADKYFDWYHKNRQNATKKRYKQVWDYIKNQEYRINHLTRNNFYSMLKKQFPNELMTVFRETYSFLLLMQDYYTGEKKAEELPPQRVYFTLKLHNKSIKYVKHKERIKRLSIEPKRKNT